MERNRWKQNNKSDYNTILMLFKNSIYLLVENDTRIVEIDLSTKDALKDNSLDYLKEVIEN